MKTTDIESWRAFGLKGLFSALRLMIQASFLRNTTWQPPFWKTALIVAHVCFFVRHASLNKGSGNKDHDNWAICKGQILLQNLSLTEHSRKICEILRHFPILLTTFMAKKLRIIFSSKLFFYDILANKKVLNLGVQWVGKLETYSHYKKLSLYQCYLGSNWTDEFASISPVSLQRSRATQ